MRPEIPSSKPFAAWVTALTDRYASDTAFKVRVQILILELLLLACAGLILAVTYQLYEASAMAVTTAEVARGQALLLVDILHERRLTLFLFLFLVFLILTLVFSLVISRIALLPARAALAFQKRFIGDAAHELRTPLSIIKTSTEVALFDPDLPKPVRETMEGTILELNRISETINNVLSFNSLTRPKAMQFAPVDLSDLAAKVIERHEELAASRGITLSASAAPSVCVQGNAAALEQAATNLVKNALYFTPAGKDGRVRVSVNELQNGSGYFEVEDNGIGIAQKDLYHIFEPFYRADTSRARGIGTGASGLGLAIVNEIARLHHGTITLRSAPKRGTSIRLTLPRAKDAPPEPLLAPSGSPHEATLDFSPTSRS